MRTAHLVVERCTPELGRHLRLERGPLAGLPFHAFLELGVPVPAELHDLVLHVGTALGASRGPGGHVARIAPSVWTVLRRIVRLQHEIDAIRRDRDRRGPFATDLDELAQEIRRRSVEQDELRAEVARRAEKGAAA